MPGCRTTRSPTQVQKWNMGVSACPSASGSAPLLVVRRPEGPEDRPPQPVQEHRRQRQGREQADAQAQRDRRPGVLDLGEGGEIQHPEPDDDRPRAGQQRPADLPDRFRQRLVAGPSVRQFLAIAGDQEEAVVRPRPEEDHDHEDPREVDDLEVQPRNPRQQGEAEQRHHHRQCDRQQGDQRQQGRSVDDQEQDDDQADRGDGRGLHARVRRLVRVVPDHRRSAHRQDRRVAFLLDGQPLGRRRQPLQGRLDAVDGQPRLLGDVGRADRDDGRARPGRRPPARCR